jgi:hypothetical protein
VNSNKKEDKAKNNLIQETEHFFLSFGFDFLIESYFTIWIFFCGSL